MSNSKHLCVQVAGISVAVVGKHRMCWYPLLSLPFVTSCLDRNITEKSSGQKVRIFSCPTVLALAGRCLLLPNIAVSSAFLHRNSTGVTILFMERANILLCLDCGRGLTVLLLCLLMAMIMVSAGITLTCRKIKNCWD